MEMTCSRKLVKTGTSTQLCKTYVRRDVRRDITTLGLDDGEGSERSATKLLVHLRCTLEETRVQIEDVTGVGLTTGGATKQEGHLTVGDGLLGQVIVDDKGVLAVVAEPLAHGTAREGREVLKRGGLRSSGRDDDGVLHRVVLLKSLDKLSDSRPLLADSDVHTVQLLLLLVALDRKSVV